MKVKRGDEEFQAILDELRTRPMINWLTKHQDPTQFWHACLGEFQGGSNMSEIVSFELLHEGPTKEVWAFMWDYPDNDLNYCVIEVMKKPITDDIPAPATQDRKETT